MTSLFGVRNFAWALVAVLATAAMHGAWLSALDRDALAVPAVAARA